ncbi:MAG TPA: SseB family protein [candidate division Zixibacteria bacterium]|nr:SseB family protein [candidate division Zixibacteria bacterium]
MSEFGLNDLLKLSLIVPIRSSSGEAVDPTRVPVEGMRHGMDERGRFLAAYTSEESYREFGPPGSDAIQLAARDVFARAEAVGERVVIDPGAPGELEVPAAVLPFLAAGIEPTSPEAMKARRPYGELPPLEVPAEVPQPFGAELTRELTELPQVARAWLLRAGTGWTVGILMDDDAPLAAFDEVRNRLHALAAEHLGGRRELAVTDLRAHPVREAYESVSGPWYERPPQKPKGILGRLFGGD